MENNGFTRIVERHFFIKNIITYNKGFIHLRSKCYIFQLNSKSIQLPSFANFNHHAASEWGESSSPNLT